MAWAPVFRGDPPTPLFIRRDALWQPAWAEDPCDSDCCEAPVHPTVNCCGPQLAACDLPEFIQVTVTGGNIECSPMNGTHTLQWTGSCGWRYESPEPAIWAIIAILSGSSSGGPCFFGASILRNKANIFGGSFGGGVIFDATTQCSASFSVQPSGSMLCNSSGMTISSSF
jgi:hypothetical protein